MDRKKVVRLQKIGLVAALLLLVGGIVLVVMNLPSRRRVEPEVYFGVPSEGEAVVVLDEALTQETAYLIDGQYYISYTFIHEALNPRFYWDRTLDCILFTTADALLTMQTGESAWLEEGERKLADYPIVLVKEDKYVIALDFVKKNSDFTYQVYDQPDRIVITSGSREVQTAQVQRQEPVRQEAGIKSPILTDLLTGDEVDVLETAGKEKWLKVRTVDGFIGYVRRRGLTDVQTAMRPDYYSGPEYTSLSVKEDRLALVWHQIDYADMNNSLADDIRNMEGINVISPTWYFLTDNAGAVGSFASKKYVRQAKKAGLEVWPLIRNFGEGVDTSAVLASRPARKAVQEYLIAEAKEIGFGGINIDFEGIPESAGDDYVQFMREMSILCRKEGLFLSVDVPVPQDWSYYYDREELGVVCDYVIMMGYDEHYAGSDLVGSVASMAFEQNGIEDMLKKENIPKEKVVSAIPFYCRLWYTATLEDGQSKVTSEACAMKNAWSVVENAGAQASWDDEAGQPYAQWTDDQGRLCQIWLEDDSTVSRRAKMVSTYDIGGIAGWVLTQEADYVWKEIAEGIR